MRATATPSRPRRSDQTRHHPLGKVCNHYAEHQLTCDEYDRMRERAANRCEICGIPEEDTPRGLLCIDHFSDGSSRHTRGLLCDRCNSLMACVDGHRKLGANRALLPEALAYRANSWQTPDGCVRAECTHAVPEDYPPIPEEQMTDDDGVTVIVSEYRVCAVPAEQPAAGYFEIQVAHVRDDLWTVTQSSIRWFAADGTMTYGNPTGDQRCDPGWQARHYMPLPDALALARRLAPHVKAGRMTVADARAGLL